MNLQFLHLRAVLPCLILPIWAGLASAATTIAGADGLTVSLDSTGAYSVVAPHPGWRFEGAVGYPLANIAVSSGTDTMGPYSEVSFDFLSDAPHHASIRAYFILKIVRFSATASADAPNTFSFPAFSSYPKGLGHLTYSGMFAFAWFYGFAPESPWTFFDSSANTFVLSPLTNLMVAATTWGPNGEMMSGVSSKIPALPNGFTHQTLLVIEGGINRAFDTWGQAMTALHGKSRPASDADVTLERLGYWTDAGSAYYYSTEPGLSYPETLAAVKAGFDQRGIALGYLQLDSWFYPKGPSADWTDRADGIYDYTVSASLFRTSLAGFQQSLGIPLVTHARWIDAVSPYRQQYRFSGNVATDPLYWGSVSRFLADSGVAAYEQDWLSDQAQTDFNLSDPDAFLDNMSAAMTRQGLAMQYCMPTTRHILQSSKYSNLTSIRVSEDRCDRTRWRNFLYGSRLASALGIWPFTDVFMSAETDNLLLATLSAGPIGVGDKIGALDAANLLHAVRPDGVIVKPDVPLVPLDSSFLRDSQTRGAPLIASTYTDFGGLRAYYLFAWPQGSNTEADFRLAELGMAGEIYLFDYATGTGQVVNASDTIKTTIAGGWMYSVAAPIGRSGMAVLGDTGHFVTLGRKRVRALSDNGTVNLTVAFAAGESARTIEGYSPDPPVPVATAGAVVAVRFDPATNRFAVTVAPGADGTASLRISRPGTDSGGGTYPPGRPNPTDPIQ